MADNVVIANLGSPAEFQEYSDKDLTLIRQYTIAPDFGETTDYVETFIYDLNNTLLYSTLDNKNYKLSPTAGKPDTGTTSTVELFPEQDVQLFGITRGSVNVQYNFYRNILSSSASTKYWIKEISPNRTELKVTSQNLSAEDINLAYSTYTATREQYPYYKDYLLNFGNNQNLIGVNLALGEDVDGEVVLLVKLYEPLPLSSQVKDTFWFVDKLSEPVAYKVDLLTPTLQEVVTVPTLRGPNFNIALNQQVGQTIEEYSYDSLFTSNISSSYQQIKSLLDEKGVEINVDYSDFNNFVHFSSATDRIYNFTYKVGLIESYSADLASLDEVIGSSTIVNGTKEVLQGKIDSLIQKFDGYEYYLYFESTSTSWPKSSSLKPYQNYSVSSSQASTWISQAITSASAYDNTNKDIFTSTIPAYLVEDPANTPYQVFLNMVGQHFDNIWIYLKDVTERFDANNDLNTGISKDLVANTLKGLGINLYTNTNISDNLYYSILGINPDGSLLPPTGSEVIGHYVTSSLQTLAAEDITLEYYKRIYHNLPYLLKTKGTERGLRALINCFGIPDTILKIKEYGGYTKAEGSPTYVDNRHTLALSTYGAQFINIPWAPLYYTYLTTGNANIVPDTIEFRFHKEGPPSSIDYYTSSLLTKGGTNNHWDTDFDFQLRLAYDPSSSIAGGPYSNYGSLVFRLNGDSVPLETSPIYLPFYDETQWWNVMIKRETGSVFAGNSTTNRYWLYVQSTFYNEEGINEIGFEGSASISVNGSTQSAYNSRWNTFDADQESSYNLRLGATMSYLSIDTNWVDTYFQEFRYWATPLSVDAFTTHTLNSLSYVGNTVTSSMYDLVYRLPLGNELNIAYYNLLSQSTWTVDYQEYELGITRVTGWDRLTSTHPARTGFIQLPETTRVYNSIGSFINGGDPYSEAKSGTNGESDEYRFKFMPFTVTDLVKVPVTGQGQQTGNKILIANTDANLELDNNGYPNQSFTGTVLSRDTSLYKENTDRVVSSPDIDVAFSPADAVDQDIISQIGYFNIDEYIGSISDSYQPTYSSLEDLKREYFRKYISKFEVWDFVRVLKYVDNSLFKMVKDFVPARTNLSTGVVLRSDILQRSKYQRHEPTVLQPQYSQSIDTAFISGSNSFGKIYSTQYTASYLTPSGALNIIRDDLREIYTGELQGTVLQVTNSGSFSEVEVSSAEVKNSDWFYTTLPFNYLFNNISESIRSLIYYDLDYSNTTLTPVNFNLITYSIQSYATGDAQYDNEVAPYARVQDYNYYSRASLRSKYSGAKTTSRLYSTYSAGDTSYGKSAAIDKIKYQYAYLVDIYTASLTLPSRSNAQIKYLIDDKEDVIDLTKSNYNLFDVQNIYKSGEMVNISLFDYSNTQQTTNRTPGFISLLNKNLELYEGGFRYYPMLHNLAGTATSLRYFYSEPVASTTQVSSGTSVTSNSTANLDKDKFRVTVGSPGFFTVEYLDGTANPIGPNPIAVVVSVSGNFGGGFSAPAYGGYRVILYPGSTSATSDAATALGGSGNYTSFTNAWIASVSEQSAEFFDYTIDSSTATTLDLQVCPSTPGAAIAYTAVPIPAGTTNLCITNTSVQPYASTLGLTFTQGGPCCRSTTITTTTYTTTGTDSEPCLRWTNANTVQLSDFITQAFIRNSQVLFDQSSDPGADNANIEPIYYPVEINTGDGIHFYTSSLGWSEQEEYRVVRTFLSGSDTSQRLYIELDRNLNSSVTATGEFGSNICKYIIAKHVPDETNLILRYNPFENDRVEEGLIFPQYLDEPVRKNSGNVIKSLRSQNLI